MIRDSNCTRRIYKGEEDDRRSSSSPLRVAIVGSVGVPANYGGFETLAEQLVRHRASDAIRYEVYCSLYAYRKFPKRFLDAALHYVPLRANGPQSVLYDFVSLCRAARQCDAILLLGVSGCSLLPLFRLFCRKRLAVNIDGPEHRRRKWGALTRRFLKFSERMAVRHADIVVADNKAVADYVQMEYGVRSRLIAYGGDHALQSSPSPQETAEVLSRLGIAECGYALAICRIVPENNVEMVLEAFSKGRCSMTLLMIGNWKGSRFGRKMLKRYGDDPSLMLHDPVHDSSILGILRRNCRAYVHGHSAGGTNPSLVEAMFAGCPVVAYDCPYNRHTTNGQAQFFDSVGTLRQMVKVPREGTALRRIAERQYRWEEIAKAYEGIYNE